MKKGIGLCLAIVMLFTLLPACAPAPEVKPISLRLASYSPPEGLVAEGLKWYVREVEERTDGRVKIEIFWAGSLAKLAEIPHALTTGAADIGTVVAPYHVELYPFIGINMGVFQITGITTPGESLKAYRQLEKEYPEVRDQFKKQNQKLLYIMEMGHLDLYFTKPIESMADLARMKVRAPGGPVYAKVFEPADMIQVGMGVAEVYDAMAKGVVDGTVGSTGVVTHWGWEEIVKTWVKPWLCGAIPCYFIAMNLDVWEKLDADLRRVMEEVGEEVEATYPSWLAKDHEKCSKVIMDAGVKVLQLSPAELEGWRAGIPTQELYDEYVKKVEGLGYPKAREIFDRYGDLLEYHP